MARFTAIPTNKISKGEQLCRVPGCPRPSHLRVRFFPDHGEDPAALSRRDIIAFTNRLAHHERTGKISVNMRVQACRDARRFLTDIRALGLTRPGGLAARLPASLAPQPGICRCSPATGETPAGPPLTTSRPSPTPTGSG